MKRLILIVLLSSLIVSCKKEPEPKSFYLKYLQLLISENNIGKKYSIKQNLKEKVYVIEAVYLGEMYSGSNKYKMMCSIGYYGNSINSVSANSVLTLFDEKDDLIGFYSMGGKLVNYPYLKNNTLLFFPDTVNNCSQKNQIDFSEEIPKAFFLECKDRMGDILKFQEPNQFEENVDN